MRPSRMFLLAGAKPGKLRGGYLSRSNAMQTVTLTASAKYGYGGKQYIARITGRDSKFTFAREFVGSKSGKRREEAEYQTDEPGLYVTCDIDRKGSKDETYHVVEQDGGGVKSATCTREEAMRLAKLLDQGMAFAAACESIWPTLTPEQELAELKAIVAAYKDQPLTDTLTSGEYKGLTRGEGRTKRAARIAELETQLGVGVEIFDPCM